MKKYEDDKLVDNLMYIGDMYQKGCRQEPWMSLCVKEQERPYYQRRLSDDINEILNEMPQELALILRNDFLTPIQQDWWKNEYAPATYHRLKNIAIHAFFRCLYA